jgi:hypothetical protein
MSVVARRKFGCSGTAYDSRFFREFFPTVESCFQIVSGGPEAANAQAPFLNPIERCMRTLRPNQPA